MKIRLLLIFLFFSNVQLSHSQPLKMITDMWDSVCNLDKKDLVMFDYRYNNTFETAHSCATSMSSCTNGLEKEVKKNKHQLTADQKTKLAQYCVNKYK